MKPSIIFHTKKTINLLIEFSHLTKSDDDLLLIILMTQKKVKVDSHVIFNFPLSLYPRINSQIFKQKWNVTEKTAFKLNRYLKYNNINYSFNHEHYINDPYTLFPDRFADRLPVKLYQSAYRYFFNRKIKPYTRKKKPVILKPVIVFLGFDFEYRGNSKYLFELMMREDYFQAIRDIYTIYFVTQNTNPVSKQFLTLNHPATKKIIADAQFVILESFQPDDVQINGTIINLWHGTPLKKLFLDADELQQNHDIFLYRYRKMNKMLNTDIFIADCHAAAPLFKTAFPIYNSTILTTGYPRIYYLTENNTNQKKRQIRNILNIKQDEKVILYLPTWRDYNYTSPSFTRLKKHFTIINRQHPVEQSNNMHSQLLTEDYIICADIIISDYSSVVFDAISIGKTTYLLMNDYKQYEESRGLYLEVLKSLESITYFDEESLEKAIVNQSYPVVDCSYCSDFKDASDFLLMFRERTNT